MTAEFAPPPGQGYDLQKVHTEQNPEFWFRWADRWWMLPNIHLLDFDTHIDVLSFGSKFANISDDATEADIAVLKEHVSALFAKLLDEGRAGQGADFIKVKRPLNVLLDLIDQWKSHSGSDEGEASASAGSSKSTGRPSKRTSTATTKSGSRTRSTVPARKAATPRGNS
ncbi:hypothetical protein AMIS_20740 [Actinoplanes missouriensis 431]|uniref:Uncharacterized protein n=1 Tax=Actinoplanes missouriensis (strain ATCC 14538 / DSM 43046 / CBS 188.64 / JCM 3121 / NBRC 102363 / NCIMB 12654 / NRRL B-3342 / UNCC 431) TaxID=512565 RepID=I0H2Q7_ACTM4|nr:hypothetical protein [Actinoplanes missouriensis]BAL87294.1 hypothetical protein AMIS_20740 [Actinoplanes missouriensis 431]